MIRENTKAILLFLLSESIWGVLFANTGWRNNYFLRTKFLLMETSIHGMAGEMEQQMRYLLVQRTETFSDNIFR